MEYKNWTIVFGLTDYWNCEKRCIEQNWKKQEFTSTSWQQKAIHPLLSRSTMIAKGMKSIWKTWKSSPRANQNTRENFWKFHTPQRDTSTWTAFICRCSRRTNHHKLIKTEVDSSHNALAVGDNEKVNWAGPLQYLPPIKQSVSINYRWLDDGHMQENACRRTPEDHSTDDVT